MTPEIPISGSMFPFSAVQENGIGAGSHPPRLVGIDTTLAPGKAALQLRQPSQPWLSGPQTQRRRLDAGGSYGAGSLKFG